MREYSTMSKTSRKTIVKALETIWQDVVLRKLKNRAPAKFGIVTDGWTGPDGLHYYGNYIVFEGKTPTECEFRLLEVSIQEEEVSFGADPYIASLKDAVRRILNTSPKESVLFVLSDHASTMQAIAAQLKVPFVGCQSHRLELACKELHKPFENQISHVNTIMMFIKTSIKYTSTLMKLSTLKPKVRQQTRWGSTQSMLERYMRVKEFLHPMLNAVATAENRAKLTKLILEAEDTVFHESLCEIMKSWKPLAKVRDLLQREQMPYAKIGKIFEVLLARFPTCAHQFDNDQYFGCTENCNYIPNQKQSIITNGTSGRYFHSAIVKLSLNALSELSSQEQMVMTKFRRMNVELTTDGSDKNADKNEEDWEKELANATRSASADSSESLYDNVRWIPSTSNVVERLWSTLRILLGTQRQRLSRKHLQMLASLKENFDLWADDERACCTALLDASGDKEDTVEDEGKEVDEPYDQEIEEDEFEDEAMVLYNAMFPDEPVAKKKSKG
jgi:hypothetical protein